LIKSIISDRAVEPANYFLLNSMWVIKQEFLLLLV